MRHVVKRHAQYKGVFMVAYKSVMILIFFCMSFFIQTHSMAPDPDADASATPDASGMADMAPSPDVSGMTAATPTPTPDASNVTAPTPDQTPTQPTGPEIKPEQMTGPDILELSEEKPGELLPSGNAQIGSLANQAKNITDQVSKTIDQMTQQHTQLQEQLGQLASELDAFYQKSGAQRGKIGEILEGIQAPPL